MEKFNFLVIGRGSMGQRRIKDLRNLGYFVKDWDIKDNVDIPNLKEFGALIISTPPQNHNFYIEKAIENNIPAFVEASVVLDDLERLNELAKEKKVLIAPSCTFKFDKYVQSLKKILDSGNIGKPLNFSYHLGYHLSLWHKNADYKTYYAAQKLTGGAKEMVTFDLTWLSWLFGMPEELRGFFGKTTDLGAEADDTYALSLKVGNILGVMVSDIVSRDYTKRLLFNTDQCQIRQDWDEVDENMYLEEMKAFIDAVKGEKSFPNDLDSDIKILKLLEDFEKKNG